MNREKFLAIFTFLFIIVLGFVFFRHYNTKTIVGLGGKDFSVEIADNNISRTKGLSGHIPLTPDQGMLFVFQNPDRYGFWMKDMTFPIDIIWIDQNFKIVHIEKALSPETYPKIFFPEVKSLYVLEILAEQSDILGLRIGDSVKLLKN